MIERVKEILEEFEGVSFEGYGRYVSPEDGAESVLIFVRVERRSYRMFKRLVKEGLDVVLIPG